MRVKNRLISIADTLIHDTMIVVSFQENNRRYVYEIKKNNLIYTYTEKENIKLYTEWKTITGLSYFFGAWGGMLFYNQIKVDKVKHFGAGYVIGMGGYTLAKICKVNHPMIVGLGSSIIIGTTKELIWDKALKRGTPSYRDALWTYVGGGFGVLTIKIIIK